MPFVPLGTRECMLKTIIFSRFAALFTKDETSQPVYGLKAWRFRSFDVCLEILDETVPRRLHPGWKPGKKGF